ncbi:MAG: L-threonylcarbamoyladenylate synthase [Dysgonamonadaceae bacterium]|jgi:L-threonylcarbamoyladenylate synthase|nr:L-threonylcarbamoyladenylate synthase [Dysgonamonadaceae bacterium]MDD3308630.1 L-threonylcarbamoyladenylate synthase [Dysgonamonadaceae bacterium]MDD3901274.1 L-threonylcarbamoyladenylate synthase [Dysgonamonadaceae bacterium]MDD4398263.1 L-threonylcarbamoyladenylate synthase [Dysgonamonadaceae bacterium]MEA5080685.1 L-threonylcarbamoyladenylate synthase [Dysgonamonadaceae bacterium]
MQEDVKKACEVLKKGGVILYPTDTIWGIGCDATNEEAVKLVYEIKQRSDSKSMLVLLDNPAKLQTYVKDVPDIAWDLIELTDKPLTIIYDGAKNLATNLIAADGSIGIRITEEKFSNELCRQFRKPIVSTSANISGEPSPASFKDISDIIKGKVDYVVEYRQREVSKTTPSSIIRLDKSGTIEIIRK